MALSALTTWSSGEVLTAAALNAEFANILNNPVSLISPLTASLDLDGNVLILDGDQDTNITADSDDRIDIAVSGTDSVIIGHDATNSSSFFLIDPGATTAQADTSVARLHVSNSNALTVPTGTTAVAAGLRVEEPNLTATGTITSAVTVYIAAAPSEGGTNNYALWVDSGATQLDGTLTTGGDVSIIVSDSRTNSVDVPLIIRSTTSGSAAAGIGTGIQFDAESGDEDPSVFGELDFAASDVSAGSEDTYMSIQLRTGGAAIGERYRFAATGANNGIFTHANSSDRTYTLRDSDMTIGGVIGTEVATTSGTSVTIDSSIPSWVRRISVNFVGVSTNGTDEILFQIGDSGGIENSGYIIVTGTSSLTAYTAGVGFPNAGAHAAADEWHGVINLYLEDATNHTWAIEGTMITVAGTDKLVSIAGSKDLDTALTQMRVTTTGGSDTFDAGAINILYYS